MKKLGVIHYNTPGETVEEFLDWVKATGFEYIELQVGDVWPDESVEAGDEPAKVKQMLDDRGLICDAVASCNDFIVLEEDDIASQVARMKTICALAAEVGADTIRTEGGQPKPSVPVEKYADAMAECLKRCLEFCEPAGMKLAVDNHGMASNDGDLLVKTFEMVGSKLVGTNLDTMNYRWAGHDLETIDRYYEIVAPWVLHTHLKDGVGCRGEYNGKALGNGEINLAKAIECCVGAGYNGVWCAEWEGKGDKGVGYAQCLEWMKVNCPDA